MATSSNVLYLPCSEEEQEQVQAQLKNLLSSHAFRNSQRYPALLRYVVEETLAGNADQLKERTLGIAVFHRSPDYDSNADPVVRVTAGEVRKRLAQYYQDHSTELRIDLPAGSYVPHFHLPGPVEPTASAAEAASGLEHPAEIPVQPGPAARSKLWAGLIAAAVLCVVVAGILILHRNRAQAALHAFWAPVTTAQPGFILGGRWAVYLPLDSSSNPAPVKQASPGDPAERVNTLSVGDALSFARVASFLSRNGHQYSAASATQTSLEDLRAHPSVLFGAFNNSWTLRATDALRFRLRAGDLTAKHPAVWIEDSTHPERRQWSMNWDEPMLSMTHDYAIVGRYFDPDTEQEVVLAAGLGENGTTAASEFLTNGHYLAQLDAFAPGHKWATRNIEAVLETEVVGGRSGPPKVVAAYFW